MSRLTILIIFLLNIPFCYAEIIKKSSSGICHDTCSSFYSRTTNFEPFESLELCLNSGGKLPKHSSKNCNSTTEAPKDSYNRKYFGGWSDDDRDCQNTRMETLLDKSNSNNIEFASVKACRIISGVWVSPFTNATITKASLIDIDHIVPLKWAWERGANNWTIETREKFANDPNNLWAVEGSLNRSKGAKGINEWLPPENKCLYILEFDKIRALYNLHLLPTELDTYNAQLKACAH
ncbi:HNH endonuclease family protein [Vibrio cortegadensis]|uniref:HNH endonuclease family protein n=1 Tax=Vibrio cortegadensis TaxID=1328770 RepID=A0ABV4M1N5_9VIBR